MYSAIMRILYLAHVSHMLGLRYAQKVKDTMPQSTIPPHMAYASHLTRTVLHPYGRGKGVSYTISLYDTGIPLPDTHGHWIGYRLYQHTPGLKGSHVLFSGSDVRGGGNTGDIMLALIDRLTTRPGDVLGERTQELTSQQLDFLVTHASALRQEATRRFGWTEALVHLRSDLEAVYHSRELRGHGPRHRMALGVVEGSGRTKTAARRELEAAIGAHASSMPRFTVGVVTGVVYAQFPHGKETVIQVVNPRDPENPLGDSARFHAKSANEADDIADTYIVEAERAAASARPPTSRPSARAARPSLPPSTIRASIRVPHA